MMTRLWTRTRTRQILGLAFAIVAILATVAYRVYATGTLTTQIRLQVSSTGQLGVGLTTVTNPVSEDYTQLFSSGTGASQASNIYHAERTITASSSEDLDLNGTLLNGFGVTLSFTKIRALIIHAAAANTNDVVIGGVNTTITSIFSDTSDKLKIKPGGTLLLTAPAAAGYALTAGSADVLTVANSSSGTSVVYDVIAIGID